MSGRMRCAAGGIAALLAWSGVAGGQAPVARALGGPVPGTPSASPGADSSLVMDVAQAERWIQGVQRDAFVPRARSTTRLTLDSLVPPPSPERRLRVTFGSAARPGARVSLTVGADGRPAREVVTPAPVPEYVQQRRVGDFGTSPERWRREEAATRVHASALIWDLLPPMSAPRTGARRVDPVARAAEAGDEREALRGERVTRVVGDTTVGGRRLLVVVDTARVRLVARWAPRERTLNDTNVVIDRTAEGVVVGRSLFDPALGLFRARVDTARLVGTAVLRYPAGVPVGTPLGGYAASIDFTTPARYERVRQWTLRDAAERAAADSLERVATRRRFGGGMVIPPPEPGTDVERRLAAGDSAVRDSLVRVWRGAADPDARAATYGLLRTYLRRRPDGAAALARLDTLAWADGDVGARYDHLASAAYPYGGARGLDVAEMREAIAFMADPGRVFALGRERDPLYENLAQGLTIWPPALLRATARYSTPRLSCQPAACRLLAAEWPGAREPRLRAVALVARAMTEPRPWGDTVRARTAARPVPSLLRAAAAVAGGVAAPGAMNIPLPPPDAPWGAWVGWMTGLDPADTAAAARTLPAFTGPNGDRLREQMIRARRAPRFGSTHSVAIGYEMLRTGRDVVGELRRGYAAADRSGAAGDSARLVFGMMLRGLNALAFTPDEVAAGLRSGEPGRVELAREALPELFADAPRADAATTAALIDRLLGALLDGQEPWPQFGEDSAAQARTPARRSAPILHQRPAPGTVFLLTDSLPPAMASRWRDRVSLVSAAEWRGRPLRAGGVLYRVSPVWRRGPFAVVELSADERLARPADSAPAMNASSMTYYLFDTGGGRWMLVSAQGWVT